MPPTVTLPNTSRHFDQLHELGLKNEWLEEVGLKALAAHNQTTTHDALTASGTYAFLETVRALRDILCPKGWEIVRQHNLELTKHPEKNIFIIVSSGTKDTGKEHGHPMTRNPKGRQTKKVVAYNAKLLRLPGMEYNFDVKEEQNIIWMLLYCIDTEKTEMRLEISLPTKMDIDELRVSGWHQRIILPVIKFEPTPTFSNAEFAPEIPFEIKRRINE